MSSKYAYNCSECGVIIRNRSDKYRHTANICQKKIKLVDTCVAQRFGHSHIMPNINNIQNIQNIQNIYINVHIPEDLTNVNPVLLKQIKDKCWETLKECKLDTQASIQKHVKENVYTLEEMKTAIKSDRMRRHLIDILFNTRDLKPKDMIQPIKLLFEKSFSPDVLNNDGSISFQDIAGLPFRIKPKAIICDVLGYDNKSPNVVWIKKRWSAVIHELIFFVGNCLFDVREKYHELTGVTEKHPFEDWWSGRTLDNISVNPQVQKFIKEIKERIESDCKDEMTAGYQALIEICNNVYMKEHATEEVEPPEGMIPCDEYETLLNERTDILGKYGVFAQEEKDRVNEINEIIAPNRAYTQLMRQKKQNLEEQRKRSSEDLERLSNIISNRLLSSA